MARQRATTTDEIVEAAARVFETKGYRASTIDDICTEAGVSRPTIYKYIDSKPWLLDQMVALVTEELGEQLDSILGGPLSAREKLQAVVRLHISAATRKRVYYATVWAEQTELTPESLANFRAWSHTVTQGFAELLADYAETEGLRTTTLDATVLANLTLTMLTSLFRWYDPLGQTSPEDLSAQILTMLSGPLPGLDDGVATALSRDRGRAMRLDEPGPAAVKPDTRSRHP